MIKKFVVWYMKKQRTAEIHYNGYTIRIFTESYYRKLHEYEVDHKEDIVKL